MGGKVTWMLMNEGTARDIPIDGTPIFAGADFVVVIAWEGRWPRQAEEKQLKERPATIPHQRLNVPSWRRGSIVLFRIIIENDPNPRNGGGSSIWPSSSRLSASSTLGAADSSPDSSTPSSPLPVA